MAKYINNEFSSSDWLRYFSNKSNHWILKYWRNNKDIFFVFSDGFIMAVLPAEIAPINGAITN